jgi:UDP-2,3-diacylglucosamine pyrophosphatase LpxH|tara:strand:- start:490 stop:663 length:174 start_codon:yes stop_codon:yes gene_type:complete
VVTEGMTEGMTEEMTEEMTEGMIEGHRHRAMRGSRDGNNLVKIHRQLKIVLTSKLFT